MSTLFKKLIANVELRIADLEKQITKRITRITNDDAKILAALRLLLIVVVMIIPGNARAFCGFYVAKADASLFNKTSQVILVRNGNRTTITMSSDFEGEVKDFAMVVPVPVVLQRNEIRTVTPQIFTTLDGYSGPRLVEYYDENPCEPRIVYDQMVSKMSMADMSTAAASKQESDHYKVKIEARYTVDEYDVLLLSADESSGLEGWLTDNGYRIPEGAREVLQPYINSGMKFFVVKVNPEELKKKGTSFLSPLQISFNSPKFMLPIRLGMANAKGSQDMIVYAFTHTGRVETSNYRTVKVPTDKNVPEFVQNYFGQFYVDTYRKHRREQGAANVFLEYAWDLSGSVMQFCDPCTGTPPMLQDLITAGVDWVQQYHYGYNGNVFFTRLHVTYDRKNFPQDLQFQETPNRENFQARYIITHPAYGEFTCEAGKKYLQDVRQRRTRELQQLAMLTGWETASYSPYINTFNYYPEGAPTYRKVVTPVIKQAPIDTGSNVVPRKDPNQIEQGAFNIPLNDDAGGNENDGASAQWMMIGIGVLLLLLVFSGRRKVVSR
ncbi:MAG: DUF2330 domain-containing protein [Chitinophagales bacterium]